MDWTFVNNKKSVSLKEAPPSRALWTTFEILFPRGPVHPSAHFDDNAHFWVSARRREGHLLFS